MRKRPLRREPERARRALELHHRAGGAVRWRRRRKPPASLDTRRKYKALIRTKHRINLSCSSSLFHEARGAGMRIARDEAKRRSAAPVAARGTGEVVQRVDAGGQYKCEKRRKMSGLDGGGGEERQADGIRGRPDGDSMPP
ncbi:hypothetical protein B0H17DRAFT_1138278 [Mycena rosella]|uniref:Uncharacterized protein n=1 Tax=Mycena rosella TaxID=1033263 RepID=A0AAD7GA12_MYCRO|nr:hypothetical protein B0H17DRAFT_1138278 [Mycena rosella]